MDIIIFSKITSSKKRKEELRWAWKKEFIKGQW